MIGTSIGTRTLLTRSKTIQSRLCDRFTGYLGPMKHNILRTMADKEQSRHWSGHTGNWMVDGGDSGEVDSEADQ